MHGYISVLCVFFFFFKQKTAYEMRISVWSSDVCSSDLEMKFRGFVFSDYTADEELIAHGYAEDARDAARLAILAGVDMSMQSGQLGRASCGEGVCQYG